MGDATAVSGQRVRKRRGYWTAPIALAPIAIGAASYFANSVVARFLPDLDQFQVRTAEAILNDVGNLRIADLHLRIAEPVELLLACAYVQVIYATLRGRGSVGLRIGFMAGNLLFAGAGWLQGLWSMVVANLVLFIFGGWKLARETLADRRKRAAD